MDKPDKDKRYIISDDGGKTVRMMRYYREDEVFGEARYIFKSGESKPRTKKTTLDCEGYWMSIPCKVWEQGILPFEFISIYEADIYKIQIDPKEPTVYFAPEGD